MNLECNLCVDDSALRILFPPNGNSGGMQICSRGLDGGKHEPRQLHGETFADRFNR